ncbi:GntR family transcriptional regulator [Paenibacillus nasutitermitis]|uniref:GntR family transcriptional regulator n=1 Tax=Paenibacillus nasutitermitis TaxID=1652958 RepID=A0A917DW99_9BACL|nr:GntR family transcriptional regulator [Paenibacillus nasutitermitis]GGD72708.1 GntR family transcriptional regulator [Paenibacillus nasutitermitis]
MRETRRFIIEKQNISEEISEIIKERILEGELNPGDRIIETKIAKELNVSQTPVREAIRLLAGEDIVTIVPNRGPSVRLLEMEDVFEIYSLRAVYESLAIRLAVKNASEEDVENLSRFYDNMKVRLNDDSVSSLLQDSHFLHQSIIYLSKHKRLIHMYKTISFQILLVNRILGSQSTKQKEIDQHWELIDALIRRDPDHAESVMKSHIKRSYFEFAAISGELGAAFKEKEWF